MTAFVALLRGINVGGHGKLAMSELADLCRALGHGDVRTYIQSGNVVFSSAAPEKAIKAGLEKALLDRMGKPVAAMVRTGAELHGVLQRNPFKDADPKRVIVLFLDDEPPAGLFADLATPGGERVVAIGREVFVHYPDGQGQSKLKLPLADKGTGRNLNTIAKLAKMAADIA